MRLWALQPLFLLFFTPWESVCVCVSPSLGLISPLMIYQMEMLQKNKFCNISVDGGLD